MWLDAKYFLLPLKPFFKWMLARWGFSKSWLSMKYININYYFFGAVWLDNFFLENVNIHTALGLIRLSVAGDKKKNAKIRSVVFTESVY